MLEVIQVNSSDLQLGMYVSGLDRPWLEVPFPMQGFRIETPEEIVRIQKYCQYVFVDSVKSSVAAGKIKRRTSSRPRKTNQQIFPGRRLKQYQDSATWGEEFPRAKAAVDTLMQTVDSIFEQVSHGGALDVVKVKQSVDPMIDSISRNPDACIWLARMKQQDTYTYQHSVGASIWAVALGRQLGLPKPDLRSLAVGGLLFDIGKLGVNQELLGATRSLTDEEFLELRSHVSLGVEMIRDSGLMNKDVLDMVAHHHERHDGSGYPDGLSGDAIPVYARIAAIVDCYDAITSHRSYARAIPPSAAIKKLYEWRDVDFQAELVEEFIQAVGIYPAGTLVELSSGEVAVVVAEYRTRRLRPKVMVLLDADKQPVMDGTIVDLLTQKSTADGKPLEISNSLEPEAYGIDMAAIKL
ncbi:MAG: HD-GYP domain-containing protein [Gammaproteobacteria bacterium]|nr:HD-GYP domain-containing protein [Gammaproteobacteria bacterium]